MTLRHFQRLTTDTSERDIRHAMSKALMVEVLRDREAFGRFYCRVLRELGRLDVTPLEDHHRPRTRKTVAGSLATA